MSDTPSQPAAVNVNVSLHLNHIAPLLEVVRAEKHRHNGRFNGKQHIADMFREIEWRVQHAEPVDPDATADEKPGIAQPAEASATLLEIHQIIECLDYASDKVSDLSQNELSDEISLTTDRAAKLLRSIFSNDVEQRLVSPDATAEDQDLGCDKCGAREDRDCTCTHPMSSSFLAASKPKLSRNAYIAQAKAYLHFGNVKPHTPENVLITGLCDLLEAEKPSPDYTALIALIRRPVGELPCSTKEMTPREHAIYLLLAKSLGNISFVADVLEAVSAPAPGCVSPALTDAREAAIEAIHPIIYADALEQFGEADVHECHEFATRIADAILPILSSFTLTHPEDAALGFAITSLEIHDCLQHAGVVQGLRARLRASDTAEGEKA